MSGLFISGGQSIGASASASDLPISIQGLFPLVLTGLISLQSKGLSRAFSDTTVWKQQFFGIQPSLRSSSHICTRYWKNHSFDYSKAFLPNFSNMGCPWKGVTMVEVALCSKGNSCKAVCRQLSDSWDKSFTEGRSSQCTQDVTTELFLLQPSIYFTLQSCTLNSFRRINSSKA